MAAAAAGRALRAALPAGLWGRLAPLPGAPRRAAAHFAFQPDPAPSEYGESAAGPGSTPRAGLNLALPPAPPYCARLLGGGRQQPPPGPEAGRQNPPGTPWGPASRAPGGGGIRTVA